MLTVVGFLIFFATLVIVSKLLDRRSKRREDTLVADAMIRSLRPVAKRRANAASIPHPFDRMDLTPVQGVPLTIPPPGGEYLLTKKPKIPKR